MSEHSFIGCFIVNKCTDLKRRLKPSSMLIAAFKIKIGRIFKAFFAIQDSRPAYTAVEPDIKNIIFLAYMSATAFRTFKISRKKILCRFVMPHCNSFFRDFICDFVGNSGINNFLAAIITTESNNGNAPGSLSRNTPVGSIFNHRGYSFSAPLRN